MPSENTKILHFNSYQKSNKTSLIIYADLEALIKKTDGCRNNPEKLPTTKIGIHIPCEYLMSMIWTFDGIENKHDVYKGKDCMKKFYESLREHTIKIIKFEKKRMILLINKEYESYLNKIMNHILINSCGFSQRVEL